MAFAADQLLTIGEILRLTPIEIENHFNVFPYDSDVQAYVETELDLWATARTSFITVEPNLRNFGSRTNPDIQKSEIRRRVALALGFDINSIAGNRLQRS